MPENATRVTDNTEEQRFVLPLAEGKQAFIQYEATRSGVLALTHTEVPEGFEGQGVGSRLVKGALDLLRDRRVTIVSRCPFVSAYLQRHPEYRSLLA